MKDKELKLSSLLLVEDIIVETIIENNLGVDCVDGESKEVDGEIIEKIEKRQYMFNVDGVFVAIGHDPNTQLFDDKALRSEGYIYTILGSTVTSVTGVYAAGDGNYIHNLTFYLKGKTHT